MCFVNLVAVLDVLKAQLRSTCGVTCGEAAEPYKLELWQRRQQSEYSHPAFVMFDQLYASNIEEGQVGLAGCNDPQQLLLANSHELKTQVLEVLKIVSKEECVGDGQRITQTPVLVQLQR